MALVECRRVLKTAEEAEDAAQEAIVRAWRHRRSCREPGTPRPWVASIARREALRRANGRGSWPLEEGVHEADPRALDALESADARLDVGRALRVLSPEDRKLLDLRYRHDLTQRSIAVELGLPEGTVKVRLHRLRKTLQGRL